MEFIENETLELKKSTSLLKAGIKSIVAILNKNREGKLYFGITDEGRIVGQDISNSTIQEVSRTISDNIEPKIYPKVNEVEIEGKKCVLVEFFGTNIPYFAYGKSYMRVGDEDRPLSAKELEQMILRKNQDKLKWDIEVCRKAEFYDINSEKLQWFLKEADLEFDSVEESLEKLDLAKDDKLLNAAVILFGKNPEKFFPNAKLRCAVFGVEDIIDMHDYEGDLFHLIKKAEEYILANIHIGMRLEGMKRIDVPEIDKDAFREAIINAFSHRDYNQYDSVNIAVFKDRVEIRNPGLLYGGLTIEEIRKNKISRRRNDLISQMFHKIHFVERWGRGIGKILRKEPRTTFQEIAGQFWTVFKRKTEEEQRRIIEGLTKEKSILDYIKNNPGKRMPQIAKILGIPKKTLERWLKKLKKKEKIRYTGSARNGGYYPK